MNDHQPARFLSDLEAKPAALERLAEALGAPGYLGDIPRDVRGVVFLGMGSSRFAAAVVAGRLREHGIAATAEYASLEAGTPPAPDMLVIAISATGESLETIAALERHAGVSLTVALTNAPGSSVARLAGRTLPLLAGDETGGVACRTFQHTGLILQALAGHLSGEAQDPPGLCRKVAMATADLLERRRDWLPEASRVLAGPQGTWILAPAERLSSAEQSALMLREGPRRPADACETGEWSHVDVYLTKTLDYRALVYGGSRWDEQAMDWLRRRGASVVAVGAPLDGARLRLRYAGDTDRDVALHAETLVAELVAADWWLGAG